MREIGTSDKGISIFAILITKIENELNIDNIPNDYKYEHNEESLYKETKLIENIKNNSYSDFNYRSKRYQYETKFNKRPVFSLNAGFSGSHFVSIHLMIFTIKYLIYNYVHENDLVCNILENRKVWIVPLLNVDGFKYIQNDFQKSFLFKNIMKNRRFLYCSK